MQHIVCTGTQGLINPKKSCRTNGCVSDVGTGLGNMPEVILSPELLGPKLLLEHDLKYRFIVVTKAFYTVKSLILNKWHTAEP